MNDPRVWGREVVQPQSSMGGRELDDPSDGPTEFIRQVPLAPGLEEEVAVPLGEIYADTEQEISRTGTMFGRLWGAVTGGGD